MTTGERKQGKTDAAQAARGGTQTGTRKASGMPPPPPPAKPRVAIIGGGMGGLSAAVYLAGAREANGEPPFECHVFENTKRLGGNMHSAYFVSKYGGPFADLAVNDFNAATYTNLCDLMRVLEDSGLPVPTGELIDQDCFFGAPLAGGVSMSYTSQEVDDPSLAPGKPYLPTLKNDWARFRSLAAAVMADEDYATMSVDEFVRVQGFSTEFRDLMLLPRINAMYFMTKGDPGRMPIRGVMYYYHLQEGLGADKGPTLRLFFEKGASQWAEQIRAYLERCGVRFEVGVTATVKRVPGGKPRVTVDGRTEEYDHVVCAVPAHAVPSVVPDLPAGMPEALAAFGAYRAEAVVHQDARVMPQDRSQWSTYNVLVNRPGQMRPYTMSYVNTMHNGVPVRDPPFVTESPFVPIAEADIYSMVDLQKDPPAPMRKARDTFTHNTVSVETMAFQDALWKAVGPDGKPLYQGRDGIWFGSGWTLGAGLQEQILAASITIAASIRGTPTADLTPVHHEGRLPHYLRRSLRGEPNPLPPEDRPRPRTASEAYTFPA